MYSSPPAIPRRSENLSPTSRRAGIRGPRGLDRRTLGIVLAGCLGVPATGQSTAEDGPSALPSIEVTPKLYHLGDSILETFVEAGVPAEPEGTRLDLDFRSEGFRGRSVLELRQRDFDNPWTVELNGERLFELRLVKADSIERYEIPAGSLRDGQNRLSLVPSRTTDDVITGEIRIVLAPLSEVLALRGFRTLIQDPEGNPLPCRITITTPGSELVELFDASAHDRAIRKGIAYTADGRLEARLPAGDYILWASHGPEWSRARQPFSLRANQAEWIQIVGPLVLEREVDTFGWISCDAHLHTLQFSGHGDASALERVVTLAGEQVDLAIATDHNHHTDYTSWQSEAGVEGWFTPIVGNEVTTPIGHINAFPFESDTDLPPSQLTDFVQIVEGIRARGGQVAILNHPRWPSMANGPFGKFDLRPLAGDWPLEGDGSRTLEALPFDGMELVNSTTLENGIRPLLADWFALRNAGHGLLAFGTSDSHTVADVVGQARSYIRSSTDDPAAIDIDEIVANIHRGQISVSMGMFCDLQVDQVYGQGDLVPCADGTVRMSFTLRAPSWVDPEQVTVYVDGLESGSFPVPAAPGRPTDFAQEFEIALPDHDCWIVCAAFGPGIDEPFWPLMRPMTFACTNPVLIDRDLDRAFASPAALALELLSDPRPPEQVLADYDDAVAIQYAALSLRRTEDSKNSPTSDLKAWSTLVAPLRRRPAVEAFVQSVLQSSRKAGSK